jgi:hypothetical protein
MTLRLLSNSAAWQFGKNWPGQRCGAKTRAGGDCKNAAVTGRKRCRMHGGAVGSGAPTGELHGRYKHGRFTQERIARSRETSAELRRLYRLGKLCGYFG